VVETGRGGFFGQEHEQFRASVRGFIERDVAPHVDAWEEARLFPRELFNKYGEEGLLGITHDEAYGGLGLDFWFAVCAAEEMVHSRCAGLNMAMLVQSDIATPILNNLGTPEQKEEFLRPAISGERIAALAVTEAHAGSDVASILTTAKREGDDYLVNGSKTFITNGTRADFLTLILKTDPEAGHGGFSVLLFPTDTKGYSVGRSLKKIGNWSSDTAEIFFDNCRVPARNLLGQEGRGFYYLMEQFQQERLAASVGAIATAQQCLVEAIEYGRSRSCFGRPIGKFQVWRHEFAQLLTEVEAGRRLVITRLICSSGASHACGRSRCRRFTAASSPTRSSIAVCSSTAAGATWTNTRSRARGGTRDSGQLARGRRKSCVRSSRSLRGSECL